MRRPPQTDGFSLNEMIVVTLLMAILVVLAYPAYQLGMASARQAGCIANLRQAGVATLAYAADNRQYLPPSTRTYLPPKDGRYDRLFWPALVAPYLELTPQNQPGQATLRCPARGSFDAAKGRNFTYGILIGKASSTDSLINSELIRGSQYERGYIRPLQTLGAGTGILADCEGGNRAQIWWPGVKGDWPLTEDRGGTGLPDSSGVLADPYNGVEFTHRGKANFFRADGSVVTLTRRQWAENQGNIWGDFNVR